jgi:rSAM/selenodomain-associated transferase 1
MNDRALIIFAKSPLGADVKTRLSDHLPDEERLGLYVSLLTSTIEKLKDIPEVDTLIAYSPPEDRDYFTGFGPETFPQSGEDIGERMYNALEKVLKEGYGKAVLVGVDIPGLSPSIVLRAFELLKDSALVFGPARDGGYYLVGTKEPVREIFQEIPWSTSHTLEETLKKASKLGFSTALTEKLSDIDTKEDLKRAGLLSF